MSATPDPTDAKADGQFQNRRAGYSSDKLGNAEYWARKGGTLNAGEGAILCEEIDRLRERLAATPQGAKLTPLTSTELNDVAERINADLSLQVSLLHGELDELHEQLDAAHKLIEDLEGKLVKQSTPGAVFDPDGSIGFSWAAKRFGDDDEPLTAAEHIDALMAMGAARVLYPFTPFGHPPKTALILPPEMHNDP